jgi:hypothetical protein
MQALRGRGSIAPTHSWPRHYRVWSASCPGRALPPGKGPPVPIVQEAEWASEPVWTQRLEETFFTSAGDRTQLLQSAVRHYTDWATLAPTHQITVEDNSCVCFILVLSFLLTDRLDKAVEWNYWLKAKSFHNSHLQNTSQAQKRAEYYL